MTTLHHYLRKYNSPIALGALAAACVMLGIVAETAIADFRNSACNGRYAFIDPQEVCGTPDVIEKTGYIATQNKIESFIAGEKAAGHVTNVSVYFRDLEDGPVFGIDETADFAPASLLKLPLALVYLTQAERDPSVLKQELSVAKPLWSFTEYYPPLETIDPTKPHTVEDLIRRMLVYSDNNAYGVLQTQIYDAGQQDFMTQTFLELGFIDPTSITDDILSVRRYAGIFRALYYTSYLNPKLSENVLNWLSQAEFTLGLRGGVPADIPIAHKFGERFTDDGVKQLHDCGIVYFPRNPYLLCVMTRGTNFDNLAAVIRAISKDVYDEVDSRRIN